MMGRFSIEAAPICIGTRGEQQTDATAPDAPDLWIPAIKSTVLRQGNASRILGPRSCTSARPPSLGTWVIAFGKVPYMKCPSELIPVSTVWMPLLIRVSRAEAPSWSNLPTKQAEETGHPTSGRRGAKVSIPFPPCLNHRTPKLLK